MEKEMEKGKNIEMMKLHMMVNIQMEKDMEKENNI